MHGSEGTGRWQHRPVTRHYEGFEGAYIGEYYSFSRVVELAEFIGEHGELGAEVLNYYGGELKDALEAIENYSGEYESLADFAFELTEAKRRRDSQIRQRLYRL